MSSDLVIVQNFINGQFVGHDALMDSVDPSTGAVWAKLPDSGAAEVDKAVQAAAAAFPGWSSLPQEKRSAALMKVADILESRLDEFARAESHDQGKTITMATKVDIPRAVHNMRFFATSCLHQTESSNYMEAFSALNYTSRAPLGVAGLISPWNLPLYLLTFKLAPALATGNTVVCKPSEMTSVTAWMFCGIFNEAGIPPGVLNMVFGTGPRAGDALVRHPNVPVISFTGGTVTGKKIQEATLGQFKKLSLELGGKNAALIFSDADLDKTVNTSIRSSFLNQGEICLCTSRIYVQRPIYQRFLDKFVKEARAIKVGDPRNNDTWMGALISKDHMTKVKGYIERAQEGGATVVCGEGVDDPPADLPKGGYFVLPTVITDVANSDAIMQEEVFGPVVCVVPFDEEHEAVQRANGVQYGLCACVHSQNVGTIHRVARQLQVGTVWANCWLVRSLQMPFGGVKASGQGREGADHSVEFFTEVKTICVQTQ